MRQAAAWTGKGDGVKRRLLIAAIFLLAGAVVNVAVAWGCAQLTLGALTEQVMRDSDLSIWRAQMHLGWPNEPYLRMEGRALGHRYEVMSGRIYFPVTAGSPAAWLKGIYKEWRIGWPLQCLERHTWLTFGKNIPSDYEFAAGQVEKGLVLLPEYGFFGRLPRRRLPVEPVWAAVIFNTVFYAAALWLLTYGLFALRRFIRVKRGRCPACAYPRGESPVCSECGKALPRRMAVTT